MILNLGIHNIQIELMSAIVRFDTNLQWKCTIQTSITIHAYIFFYSDN